MKSVKKLYFLSLLLDALVLLVGFSPLFLPVRACVITNRSLYNAVSLIVSFRGWLLLVLCAANLALLIQFSDRMKRRYWWLLMAVLVLAFFVVVAANIGAKLSLGICGLDV